MKVVLLIGAFQALFFTALILQKKQKAAHDYILAAWLSFLAILIGVYAYYTEELFDRSPHLISSYISLLMLHGPFLYFYTGALVSGGKRIMTCKSLLHLIPIVLFNIYLAVAFSDPLLAAKVRLDYVDSGVKLPWLYIVFLLATAFSGPFYIVWVIKLLHGHEMYLLNNYSFHEKINLTWLRNLVLIFGVVWLALFVFAFLHHLMFLFTRDFCTNGLFISLTVFVLLTGYFGLKQSVILQPAPPTDKSVMADNKRRYSGSALTKDAGHELMKRLEKLMQTEKPYLDAGLTLEQLSDRSEIPQHYLSQIINERLNRNFFDYINTYRVKEVMDKMADKKYENFSLLGIALDSGFNSKSAFNRFFKKATGNTPSDYKSSLLRSGR
jgi:AraC-like DNA-binding protein